MDVTYKQLDAGCYRVSSDEMIVGVVRKSERFSGRGPPIMWIASFKGKYVGVADTRKEASELLLLRQLPSKTHQGV